MNTEQARFNMIEQQIRPWNVLEQDVLDLLMVVKREDFVPAAYKSLAFMDTEIPLPDGENMLQPKVEARVLQAAAVKKHEHVLEIGAGSGYMAALLAHKARQVTTVEINPAIRAMAQQNLSAYGIANVDVQLGNGAQGWPANEPGGAAEYDVIVISGSLPFLPDSILAQVKVGGRIVAFVGQAPAMSAEVVTRTGDRVYDTVKLFETVVKPLHAAIQPSTFTF